MMIWVIAVTAAYFISTSYIHWLPWDPKTGPFYQSNIQTIDQWGKSHYENFGKTEGRTLPANGNYEDYVRNYPDLLAAYNASVVSSEGEGNSQVGDRPPWWHWEYPR